jgi:hypothetical protein
MEMRFENYFNYQKQTILQKKIPFFVTLANEILLLGSLFILSAKSITMFLLVG